MAEPETLTMDWQSIWRVVISASTLGALIAAVSTWIKTRPAMKTAETQGQAAIKQLQMNGEAALRERINGLEARLDKSAEECDRRMERMGERHDHAIAELEGEIRFLRHDRNNVRAGFNALLAMIKRLDVAELSSIALAVEEMVRNGDQAIATEKGVFEAMKGKPAT